MSLFTEWIGMGLSLHYFLTTDVHWKKSINNLVKLLVLQKLCNLGKDSEEIKMLKKYPVPLFLLAINFFIFRFYCNFHSLVNYHRRNSSITLVMWKISSPLQFPWKARAGGEEKRRRWYFQRKVRFSREAIISKSFSK